LSYETKISPREESLSKHSVIKTRIFLNFQSINQFGGWNLSQLPTFLGILLRYTIFL